MEERRTFLKQTGLVLLGAAGSTIAAPVLAKHSEHPPQPAILIDLNRCMGCHSCVIACKEQNQTPPGCYNTTIETGETGTYPNSRRTFTPSLCHHCADPACISACKQGATFKTDWGIVVTDWSKCQGDGACVSACPYNARYQDQDNGNKPGKCDLCLTRISRGLEPACVESCSAGARLFGDMAKPQGEFGEYLSRIQQDGDRLIYTMLNSF